MALGDDRAMMPDERAGQSARSAVGIFHVRIHAGTGVNLFAIDVGPHEILPPVKIGLPRPCVGVAVRQVIVKVL